MKKDVEEPIARLRAAVEQARSMPMSASAVINRAEVLELVDAVSTALDEAFSAANEVVGDRDAVVQSGRAEADEIVRQARDESDRLVSETHVFQVAQERAAEVEETARREADELRAETDRYVEEKLANFEASLVRTLDAVRRGRARISEETPEAPAPAEEEGLGFPPVEEPV